MTDYATLAARHERIAALVTELDIDECQNDYGVAPCTASGPVGSECYRCWASCQDKPNFVRGTQTIKLCTRGMPPVIGETMRPYITDVSSVPTEIDPAQGLATRSQTQIKLTDEPCSDYGIDPYAATRLTPAQGTYWTRFLARHPNTSGRFARVRRGFIDPVAGFSWDGFQTELYVIESIRGPSAAGVTVVLSDAIKLLDRAKLPAATDGKLAAELAGAAHIGVAKGASWTTITLSDDAQPIDDLYNGHEVVILDNIGSGQRRIIADYVGATRQATLTTAWAVPPEAVSTYEVAPLSLTLATGKGAQYADPAVTGRPEFVRLGDEILRYTAKSGDTLSWPDGTYRAQFGTTREAHKLDSGVQQCWAVIDQTPAAVLQRLLNAGGLADSLLDLAELASECAMWLALGSKLTACISKPETVSALYAELLRDLNLFSWWHPVEQKVRFRANMPGLDPEPPLLTDDDFMLKSVEVETLDAERITETTIRYAMRSASADEKKAASYGAGEMAIDLDAKSANEYGDSRPEEINSRWLGPQNALLVRALAFRRLVRRRDAPRRVKFQLDPRSSVAVGDLRRIQSKWRTDLTGAPLVFEVRIVKLRIKPTHLEAEALTTGYTGRPAFIAPAGLPTYASATDAQRIYAFVSPAAGTFADGTSAYTIV